MRKLLLGLLIAIVGVACQRDEDTSRLNVSENTLNFEYFESQQSISLGTSKKLKISVNRNWVSIKQEQDKLVVSVTDNITFEERIARILIQDGSVEKTIYIYQAPIEFTIEPNKIETDTSGGNFVLTAKTALQQWAVSTNRNWISASISNQNANEINVMVSEHTESSERTGKIIITFKEVKILEVPVTQTGKNELVLPFFGFGKTATDVKSFESARRNKLLKEESLGEGSTISFQVNDAVFSKITYLVNLKGYVKAGLWGKENVISEQDKKTFEDFLLENGFEKRQELGYANLLATVKTPKDIFYNSTEQVKIEFYNDPRANHYAATYYPVQQVPHPTFTTLPSLFKKGATKQEVEQWEATNNGTHNTNASTSSTNNDKLFFDVNKGNLLARAHWVYYPGHTKQGLSQTTFYYDNYSYAFFKGKDGDYYLSDEFKALVNSNGYEYRGKSTNTGADIFRKGTTGNFQYISVRWYKDANINWTLAVSVY